MPPDINPIDNIRTVEDLFDDITSFVEVRQKQDTPSLYVVDSLDALSDEAELKRDIRKGSFGAQKAANLSELFRRLNALMNNANTTLMNISQIRDNVGVMFGAKETRSGGKALGFYSSQIIWLKEIKRITRTVSGNSRSIGSQVRVRCSKNKVGKPRRECVINVMYNYGVDDETSMLDFLEEYKAAPALIKDVNSQLIEARRRQDREWLSEINTLLAAMVTDKWDEIEAAIAPTMRKYG
jgi:RecA/RadA recombinase